MRLNTKRAATVIGAMTATVALLSQGVAQAAPITRTATCARFTGDYTYWKNSDGWYGYRLTGTVTRTCSGSGFHGIQVTGDRKNGDAYYDYEGHSVSGSIRINGFSESGGVKNIRIALD
ncbi:hypothetical protein Q5762_02825 [Streptomyces sp. P9(2023)]|uniref:hypothetical protein n=1 Tax=Streptomyces sp. P9(2023) TaxID=3064394 RepID=UPI0028F402F6|nr:hypothetical protein [Streptomyces sp. P9(2023)]MDT9687297.1 hypothetical protein [Streptomyces sp. P9(2023)]